MLISTELEAVRTPLENGTSLSTYVIQTVKSYFAVLKQEDPVNLYQTIIEAVEIPLLKFVMEQHQYNQSKAAQILGLSRGTLHTKLRYHFQDRYAGTHAAHKITSKQTKKK